MTDVAAVNPTAAATVSQNIAQESDNDSVGVMSTPQHHMAEAARKIQYLHHQIGKLGDTNNIVVTAVVKSEQDNDGDDGILPATTTAGESVTISKSALPGVVLFEEENIATPIGESVLPALVCSSDRDILAKNDTGNNNKKNRRRRKTLSSQNAAGVTKRAAELMCMAVPSSAVTDGGCSNPLAPSPKQYTLSTVLSSEANAGYVPSPPKPKRTQRSISDSTATLLNRTNGDNNTITMQHVSNIAFKATVAPPSLRAITKIRKPRAERFDYAKALLRSDEELEKLSHRIRKEINESELFELALAAERAAEAGEEKFAGRASTFGDEQQHNQHKYQPLSPSSSHQEQQQRHHDAQRSGNARIMSTGTLSTVSVTTATSPTSFVGKKRVISGDKLPMAIPTIGTTPNTPDRRIDEFLAAASPILMISASERSLLETLTAVPVPHEPAKRSMGVDSLRDVNEVIPHWKELHEHMRTHLYRESVEEKVLFFGGEGAATSRKKQKEAETTTTIALRSESGSTKNNPQHRRSKSFFESLKGMTMSSFGGASKRDRQQQIVSTGSFDFNMYTDLTGDVSDDATTSDASEISTGLRNFTANSFSIDHPLKSIPSVFGRELDHPTNNTAIDSSTNIKSKCSDLEPFQQEWITQELRFDDPAPVQTSMDKNLDQPKSLSACSSDTSSVASNVSDAGEVIVAHIKPPGGHQCDQSRNDPVLIFEKDTRSPPKIDSSLLKGVVSPASLMDDEISVTPASPIPRSYVTRAYGPNHATPPTTPKDSDTQIRNEFGFNTPAHLRVIKGLKRDLEEVKNIQDAPSQPGFVDAFCSEAATTPAVHFPPHFEPNSIVDSMSSRPNISFKTSKPALPERETRFLALPVISTSKSENNLQKLPSRRIPRRKINRAKWLDSPTTPTDPMERMLMQKNGFLSQTASYMEVPVSAFDHEGLQELSHTFDEAYQATPDSVSSSSDEKATVESALDTRVEIGGLPQKDSGIESASSAIFKPGTEYREEKKECDDFASGSLYPPMLLKGEEITVPHTPPEPAKEDLSFAFAPVYDSRHDGDRMNPRVLVKSLSAPDSPCHEDNSVMNHSLTTTKSAPKVSATCEDESIPFLKRTGTWDGVVSTNSIDPISVVNSFINNTSAAVNDAAGFLVDITTGDSKETNDASRMQDGSSSLLDHRRSCLVRTNALCHGDENIKAAVQGVLSHLSLSPRYAEQKINEVSLFLADSENREFLQNYFYCTKTNDDNENGNLNESDEANVTNVDRVEGEQVDMDNFAGPAGIACAVEPCNGAETNCHMFGVDAVCSGFSCLFPRPSDYDTSTRTNGTTRLNRNSSKGNIDDSLPSSNHSQRNEAMQQMARQRSRSASFSQCNNDMVADVPNFANSARGVTNLQDSRTGYNQQRRRLSYGRQESWMDVFQRVATSSTRRFSFVGGMMMDDEADFQQQPHPFTPPCLARRVLTRNQAG